MLWWTLTLLINSSPYSAIIPKLRKTVDIIIAMVRLLWSEGYCYFLDFWEIAYYPATNRLTGRGNGVRFPHVTFRRIADLSQNEAREMTRFSLTQLQDLLLHLRISETLTMSSRYTFGGEQALFHYLYWMRDG